MRVTLQLKTVQKPLLVHVVADININSVETLDRIIRQLKTARAWLNKELDES